MLAACGYCGRTFDAARPSAKFCGATCRQRSKRARDAGLDVAPAVARDAVDVDGHPLVVATRGALADKGVLESVAGQAAMVLAARVAAGADTGAAVSSMVKELRAAVAEALGSVKRADRMDEVGARRDAKLRSAGRA